jgi:hypothetical protein
MRLQGRGRPHARPHKARSARPPQWSTSSTRRLTVRLPAAGDSAVRMMPITGRCPSGSSKCAPHLGQARVCPPMGPRLPHDSGCGQRGPGQRHVGAAARDIRRGCLLSRCAIRTRLPSCPNRCTVGSRTRSRRGSQAAVRSPAIGYHRHTGAGARRPGPSPM